MKINWHGISNKAKIVPSHEESPVEPVNILEVRGNDDAVHLRLAMSRGFYDELYEFLEQNGLTYWGNDKRVVPLFIQYGLSEESRGDLEKYENELLQVSSRYAAINFQTSEYYARNQAIAMGLRMHLEENKYLKQKMKANDLASYLLEDEWDKWDDNYINELYRKYVFGK
jgi:hypothetical protein